ncbi:hypothetical protein DM02DRAFT_617016 [Periconia macrospinosa]|uniref:DUF788-domain-containing protein n=1 Tax=Periconia macrospinosa TaxID=97972 RepID=A0A2V1DF25_9PLEO|nr:hypothetical protein DM02DRAFT_617016 [Periconia macrospinosa]
MAQKATKALASSNTRRLNQTLLITLILHTLFWLTRFVLWRPTYPRKTIILYLLFSSPQLLINLLFERQSRPTHLADGTIKRSGEDLDAKGLTEYLWDVTYWTYGCLALVTLFGDWAWWFWVVVPLYSVYAAWTTYTGVRGGFTDSAGVPQQAGASKRQLKMEKRGGQKVQYRS